MYTFLKCEVGSWLDSRCSNLHRPLVLMVLMLVLVNPKKPTWNSTLLL